jgi:hypothetical protein
MELMLGISVPGYKFSHDALNTNFTSAMAQASSAIANSAVQTAINKAVIILMQLGFDHGIDAILDPANSWEGSAERMVAEPLITKYALSHLMACRALGD